MASTSDTRTRTGYYVYGIVPGDVEVESGARGIGDQPITLVRHGDVAALVSEVETGAPLGEPADLQAHARVLDSTAGALPVLPLRFGAVLDSEDAVADELLAAHQDEFRAALEELDGYAEYVVKGRYEEKAVLNEVLSTNDTAAQLREAIRGKPEEATRNERIALGELIDNAVIAMRQEDTRQVMELLDKLGLRLSPRPTTHELEAVHVACLVEVAKEDKLEQVIGELGRNWAGRVEMRLLGPLAPYDFVVTQQPRE